jgi:hypothetical protein
MVSMSPPSASLRRNRWSAGGFHDRIGRRSEAVRDKGDHGRIDHAIVERPFPSRHAHGPLQLSACNATTIDAGSQARHQHHTRHPPPATTSEGSCWSERYRAAATRSR